MYGPVPANLNHCSVLEAAPLGESDDADCHTYRASDYVDEHGSDRNNAPTVGDLVGG